MCATCLGILVFYYLFLISYMSTFINVVWLICMTLMFISLYFVKQDPGKLHQSDDVLDDVSMMLSFCPYCMLGRHIQRVHHCRRCEQCVLRFDQLSFLLNREDLFLVDVFKKPISHCPWIDSCIGLRNNVPFFLMLFFANVSHVIWLTQSLWVLSDIGWMIHLGLGMFFVFCLFVCFFFFFFFFFF